MDAHGLMDEVNPNLFLSPQFEELKLKQGSEEEEEVKFGERKM